MLDPGAKRCDVVGVGLNCIDHLCVLSRPVRFDAKQQMVGFDRQPGGQIPTALVALQRWGLRTSYIGSFGDDAAGRQSRTALEADGVDVDGCVARSGVRSQEAVILIDRVSGERSVVWDRPEGLALTAAELPRKQIESARMLMLDAYDIDVALTAARWARDAGASVMLDVDVPLPGTDELLALCDFLIVSREFLVRLAATSDLRAALRSTARYGPRVCAVTLGAGGVLALVGRRTFHYTPAFRRPFVDATGAGDVFHAGYAYGVLRGWDAPQTLRFASAAAALKCEKLGGRPGIPTVARALALANGPATGGSSVAGRAE